MTHSKKRIYLIQKLLSEQKKYRDMEIPDNIEEQKQLLRGLMNIRSPRSIGVEFLKVQDEYLREEVKEKGITDSNNYARLQSSLQLCTSHSRTDCIGHFNKKAL